MENKQIVFDLEFKFKKLDGDDLMTTPSEDSKEESEALWAHKVLGNHLASHNKGDALKYLGWGKTLYNSGKLEVGAGDADKIKKFVDENENMTALMAGQLLEVVNKAIAEYEAQKDKNKDDK